MQLSAEQIKRIAGVLEAVEPFESASWDKRIKVRRMVVEVGGANVTLSRRSKYASLRVSKVESL